MQSILNSIRSPTEKQPAFRRTAHTLLVAIFGLALGLFSKMLDCTASNDLFHLFQFLDFSNFLGRIAIWILLAVAISVYSSTPLRAALHVFLFFAGMLTSYYLYTKFAAGFFPKSYALFWAVLALFSPIPGFLCWYAKGRGKIALLLSSSIAGILFCQAFGFGMFYFDILYEGLEAVVWLACVALLYQNPKQLLQMLGLSLIAALIWKAVSPFGFI